MSKSKKIEQTNETTATEQKTYDMVALIDQFGGVKAKVIRFLASENVKTAEITKLMKSVYPEFRYQHARNVLNQKVKSS